jgi:UDPglucose--hexose-1-phosphate uridylyltransferase
VIIENENFVAFAPYASRFPFEVCVIPKRHESNYENIDESMIEDLASIMKEVLKKLNSALDNPPYNYMIHNSPIKATGLMHYHWHIEIIPKLIQVAGFEWGTGFYINPTPPEEAAKFLRELE